MWAQSNLLLYSLQRDATRQHCPGPDTIWLLPLGLLLFTLYSDGKEEESREERLISVWCCRKTLSLALVARGKKVFLTVWKKLFQGSSLALFSEEDFITITWSKCCFTACFTLPRTHFWKRIWQKPSPGSRHLPIGKKEVISLLHGTFKGKNKATDLSPVSFKTIWTSGDSVFIDFVFTDYFYTIMWMNGLKYRCSLFSFTNHHFHLTCFHLCGRLSFLFPHCSLFFQKMLLWFHFYLIGHSLHM